MTFQAGLTAIEVDFNVEEEDEDPKPLRMEHFYFPLGTWLIGILLSVFCFIVETIFHCLGKSKTNVPTAVHQEPGVNLSIPESEVEHNSDVGDIEDIKV